MIREIGSGHVVVYYEGAEHIFSEGQEVHLKGTVTRTWDS